MKKAETFHPMDPNRPIPKVPEAEIVHAEPEWFRDAIAAPHETRALMVDGASVNYLRWGDNDPTRPGVLFVHGNGAHAKWFSFIAPLLTSELNVASVDLPGMGDSDWRDGYSRESFAHAIAEIAADADLGPKPVIVGHSFGGFVTLIAASLYGERFGGIVLADFAVRAPEEHVEWFLDQPPRKPTRIYPDYETALGRFRLAPAQDCANRYIVDYIARHSLIEVRKGDNPGRGPSAEAGWTWKFDPSVFNGLRMGSDHAELYASLPCKAASVFGMESVHYDPARMAYLRELGPRHALFAIPGAQHHIMLDRPHAFAAAVDALMAAWRTEGALSG